jgi:hypothetical protein
MAWDTVTGLAAEDSLVLVCDGCGDVRTWTRDDLLNAVGDANLNEIGACSELRCQTCSEQPGRGWFTWQAGVD